MISITCTNCQTALSIDDAFAGGVCRCQHCGTIQTVPSKKKDGPGGTAAGLGVKTPKTLYQKRVRDASVGTGLDELAEVVTSSGLAGSGLSSRSPRPAGSVAAPVQKSNMTMILGVAAIVVIALLIVILIVVTRRDPAATMAGQPTGTGGAKTGAVTPAASNPSFCGVQLEHPSIIYLLDRGSSTQAPFGSLKEATLKSIATLGPERRFQILFWDNGQDPGAFPPLLSYANPGNLETVRRQTDEVYAFGATDAAPALAKAIAQRPAAIIIATGKGADLDDAFVQMVKDTKKDLSVVIHTFAIGSGGPSAALKAVAEMTGGEYRELSEAELSKFGG